MQPHEEDARLHVVFVIAEQEYDSAKTFPQFAKTHLSDDFRCTFVCAKGNQGTDRNDVPGLEALYDADLLVLSMRHRALPVVQMDHLERYIRVGKPIVAIRASAAPFQVDSAPPGHVIWRTFDQGVLGCHYTGRGSRVATRGLWRLGCAGGDRARRRLWSEVGCVSQPDADLQRESADRDGCPTDGRARIKRVTRPARGMDQSP